MEQRMRCCIIGEYIVAARGKGSFTVERSGKTARTSLFLDEFLHLSQSPSNGSSPFCIQRCVYFRTIALPPMQRKMLQPSTPDLRSLQQGAIPGNLKRPHPTSP